MERFLQRKSDFTKAVISLKQGLLEPESEIVIDGILHRFEFTFELSWKLLKDYLEYNGIINNIGSPREIIKCAYKEGIIKDGDIWIDMMLSRNLLSHLYSEENSRKIYLKIKNEYIKEFENLITSFR